MPGQTATETGRRATATVARHDGGRDDARLPAPPASPQAGNVGRPYHAWPAEDVLVALAADPDGLGADEAARRLQRHGRNQLPPAPRRHPLARLFAQINNALIYFMLAGAVAAFSLGHTVDAAVIVIVVAINAVVGFIQEGKAENALAAIQRMISPRASILRGGQRASVPVEDLVPGDIVLLEPGDRVPADLRLIRTRGLLIDEAILTGESVAAEKGETPVNADAPLGDRISMAYSGTMVAAGQGSGVVTATSIATEIGRISTLLGSIEELTTPLLKQINSFGRRFTWVVIASSAALFLFAVYARQFDWTDAMIAVVALAVGVVPEGLPAVITITLAVGVRRMAGRQAVIRRLPAVETLGAVSVICSDKTGTLTRNEMTARRIVLADGEIAIEGSGYAPEHGAWGAGAAPAALAPVLALVRAGLLCNDAHLRHAARTWTVEGDPMEGALITLAMKAGFDPDTVRAEWRRADDVPFDPERRYMATLNHVPYDRSVVFVKGAPERLLEMCATQARVDGEEPLDIAYWNERIAAAASAGERVLGFAMKPVAGTPRHLSPAAAERDLTFLGIVGFIDPPRDEAIAAIAECRSAGIDVKMITGDHAATAAAIARQLGLTDTPRVLTGHDLDNLGDAAFEDAVRNTAVFARTSPEHKLRIVRALQADGAIVAMTGDGVNDAPSLKQADVGIAMGGKGTEAAKEASQMVLLDDNFASIVAAVREGRTVYDNIRKVIGWTLPTNGGEVLTVIIAIVLNFAMPMTPAQILWINMILTITLGLVLAFEPTEPGVMERPPRPPGAGLLSPFLVWRIVFVSLIFAAWALAVFFYALGRGLDLDTARTMVVNTIVVLEIFYLFNVRYLYMTSFTWRGALGTPPVLAAIAAVVVAQVAFTYWPVLQRLFATRPVGLADGMMIVAAGFVAMVVLEGEKRLMRHYGWLRRY